MKAPRASGSACGVRSPARYGAKRSPSAPGAQRAASSSSTPYAAPTHAAEPGERAGCAQHHAHRVPGAGHRVAEDVHARLRVRRVGGQRGEDDARRAEHDRHGPGLDDPDAERGGRLVARARDLGRLVHGRKPLERHVERRADLVRPAAAGDVEEQRAGRVGDVDRVLAGEAETHVVLRQQHVPDARVRLGLVTAQPEELRRREAGERAVPGQLDQPLEPDARLDLGALGCRPLVVPEDRRPQDAVVRVEHDEAVHLPGEADRPFREALQARLGCAPPVLGVLLGPAGLRRRERVLLGRRREHAAVGRDATALTPVVPTSSPTRTSWLTVGQAPSAA